MRNLTKTPLLLYISFGMVVFFLFFTVNIQSSKADYLGSEPFRFDVSPENPGLYTSVSFKVTSFISDFDISNISWYVNNKLIQTGKGDTAFSTKTGGVGEPIAVRVVIIKSDGTTLQKEADFNSALVDLVYDTNSYTPPFYKGKALAGAQSSITVSAIPQFTQNGVSDPSNLTFTWKRDGQPLNDQSGVGKSSIIIPGLGIDGQANIGVSVSSSNGESAVNNLVINATDPKIGLYTNDHLYGVEYNRSLKDWFTLNSDEIIISAIPFFADAISKNDSSIKYSWFLDASPVQSQNLPNSIVLRKSGTGQSSIYVSISSNKGSFSPVSKLFQISY